MSVRHPEPDEDPSVRLGGVLDVETVLCDDAFALVSDKTRGGFGRRTLHRTVCASVLAFAERGPHGELEVLGLQSFHLGGMTEPELLLSVDAALPDPLEDSRLVSFNGAAHDLEALRQRAIRLWLFDLPRLRGWTAPGRRHVDLIHSFGGGGARRPSLEDVGALLGAAVRRSSRTHNVAESARKGQWDAIVRRNQVDVAATFLAYAHDSAWRRGCALPATSGWTSLADWTRALRSRSLHLAEFSRNALVELARSRSDDVRFGRDACNCEASG